MLDDSLDEYYDIRGWTRDGKLTERKLKELDIDEFDVSNVPLVADPVTEGE